MGKNKGSQKNQKAKNVFKVATGRSVKLKAKAQKVMTNLKKLDVKGSKKNTKEKLAHMDQHFEALRKEVHKSTPKQKPAKKQGNNKPKKTRNVAPAQTEAAISLVEQMQI